MKRMKWLAVSAVAALILILVTPGIVSAALAPPGTLLWGYEAASANARMLTYDIGLETNVGSFVPAGGQVPPNTSGNGRGVTYDPIDGNLWYTVLNKALFTGDGLIHKVATTGGPDITTIPAPVASIGAMDTDPIDHHIWAAEYQPVIVTLPDGTQQQRSYIYKIHRTTGAVLQSGWVPFGGGGVGNDTLAVQKFPLLSLPGSGKYVLTDAGEPSTNQGGSYGKLLVIDAATLVGGGPGNIVASLAKVVPMTGIDFRRGELIACNLSTIYNLGKWPFSSVIDSMSASPSNLVEDITLKRARHVKIDIKPGSDPNSINPKSKGVIPVAILGSSFFDVTLVDTATLMFGPGGAQPVQWAYEDVNGDGHMDLVSHYKTQETGIAAGDELACLRATLLLSGLSIKGCDSVRTVGK